MATVVLKNVNKIYPGGNQAVYDFNLEIKDKEFIVLVGPSGCGKSTTLRMIAGLEEITSGELYIDGQFMNDVLAKNRGIAMVFQSYALFPQMTVYDNMAFGLKLRKMPKDEIKRRIMDVAHTLGLEPYLDRKPKALSGGQRQRVALGRAIVKDAKVFLYDEPLSNLDAKLRGQMRTEIARIHKNIGATSIYVTHDQVEAMTMATKIVVMRDGYIQQIGTPEEVYNHPANVFVGGFIGTPAMNFIRGYVNDDGEFVTEDGENRVKLPKDKFDVIKKHFEEKRLLAETKALEDVMKPSAENTEENVEVPSNTEEDNKVIIGIRPEEIHVGQKALKSLADSSFEVNVEFVEMLGHESNVHFNIGSTRIVSVVSSKQKIQAEDTVTVGIDLANCHFFDADSELIIV